MITRMQIRPDVPQHRQRDVLAVGQGRFGYIDREVTERLGFTKVETYGLVYCVALVLRDRSEEVVVLLHADYYANHSEEIAKAVLPIKGLTNFEDATIVALSHN